MLEISQNPRQKQSPVYKETILSNAVWARYRLNLFYSQEVFQDKNDGFFSIIYFSVANLSIMKVTQIMGVKIA